MGSVAEELAAGPLAPRADGLGGMFSVIKSFGH